MATTSGVPARLRAIEKLCGLTLAVGGASCAILAVAGVLRASGAAGPPPRHAGLLLVYAALSASAAALQLAALRLKAGIRVNAALAALSTWGVLYAAELTFLPTTTDTTRLDAVMRLRRQGIMAYPSIFPGLFVRDGANNQTGVFIVVDGTPTLPLGGISGVTTVECSEAGETVVYESDEHGFNNPRGTWAGTVDVAVVGDSYAKGMCVQPQRNMLAGVRRRNPRVLNLANVANGPLAMLAGIREYLPTLRPRVVLWGYFGGNDFFDLRLEKGHPILVRYLEAEFSQGLESRQAEIDAQLEVFFESALKGERDHGRYSAVDILLLRHLRRRLFVLLQPMDPSFVPTEVELGLFGRILAEAKRSVETWDGRLYFMYLPAWRELYERQEWQQRLRERVLGRAAELGLPIIDLFDAMEDAGPSAFACPRTCHYSAEGYERAGQQLVEALVEDRLL